jgi:hypothetical protein
MTQQLHGKALCYSIPLAVDPPAKSATITEQQVDQFHFQPLSADMIASTTSLPNICF